MCRVRGGGTHSAVVDRGIERSDNNIIWTIEQRLTSRTLFLVGEELVGAFN